MKYLTETHRVAVLMIEYINKYKTQKEVVQLFCELHSDLPLIAQKTDTKTYVLLSNVTVMTS